MKKVLFLVVSVILSSAVFATEKPNSVAENKTSSVKPTAPKPKQGNVLEEWEVTINLGIVTLKLKGIRCDKMADRICYMKQGETTAGSHASITIPSLNKGYGGTLQYDATEVDEGNTVSSEFTFDESTYYEF